MSDLTNNKQIQELLDRESIRDLAIKYAHHIWQGDIDGWVNLYAEDGAITSDHPDRPASRGHAQLRELAEAVVRDSRPRPFVHNHVIDLIGPYDATGTCYTEVHLSIEGERGLVVGLYHDRYVKIDNQWKFKERKSDIEYFGLESEYQVPESKNKKHFGK